jgi:integrase
VSVNGYEIRLWQPRHIGDTSRGRWRVRWQVAGREHCQSFPVRALADQFAGELKAAARAGIRFDELTGLPAAAPAASTGRTWLEHACWYAQLKWPQLAGTSRRSVAEALTTVTVTLTATRRGAPDPAVLRAALFGWAFNCGATAPPPAEVKSALDWAARASLPVSALDNPAVVRAVLDACARTLGGQPTAATTQRRKRAVFHNALAYAVEQGLLPANPADLVRWTAPGVAPTVDRRVVVSPVQAAALLAAVGGQDDRGKHLEAFFGCLYYAALRPSEAVALRDCDCVLPAEGWGRIDLAGSAPRPGRAWTDDHRSRQPRGLKHRADGETRSIPIPPVLASLLRAHIARYGVAPDGRLFRTARGGLIQDSAYTKVWQQARAAALTEAQQASPLAARPYDLRHAGVSLWLNSGVPATEVARRAGHSVAVLLKIYAHCADGPSDAANDRIAASLAAADGDAA